MGTSWRQTCNPETLICRDEYPVGAIVYMHVANFVTYEDCTLYPGPCLNMLLGPNGSGKSSLVAAMALGLGFPAALLGRSKDPADFIRYGDKQATIEIGLKVDSVALRQSALASYLEEDDILLVKRQMERSEKGKLSNRWTLNDQEVGARQIQAMCRLLRIQVDNLCQFLPQDRVSEFARLNPRELLIECERAAVVNGCDLPADEGNDETFENEEESRSTVYADSLLADHERLKALRSEERQLDNQMSSDQREREGLVRTNELLGRNIERHAQRQALLKQVGLARRKLPWMQYQEAREAYLQARDLTKRKKEDLEQRKTRLMPLKAELDRLQQEEEALQGNLQESSSQRRGLQENSRRASSQRPVSNVLVPLRAARKEIKELGERMDGKREEILDKRRLKQQVLESIEQVRTKIAGMEQRQRTAQSEKLTLQAKLDEVAKQAMDAGEQADEARRALDEEESVNSKRQRQSHGLQAELQGLHDRLHRAGDAQARRFEVVKKLSPDTYKAWHWLQDQPQLKERIFGPVAACMHCPDPRYASLLESLMPRNQALSFVAVDAAAMEEFLGAVEDRQRLKVNVVNLNGNVNPEASCFSQAELRSWGFEAMAADLIEAPAAIKAALRWHLNPVSLRPLSKPEWVEKELLERVQNDSVRYVAGERMFDVRRSRFDAGELISRAQSLKAANFLSAATSPSTEVAELEATVRTKREQLEELRREISSGLDRHQRMKAAYQAAASHRDELSKERSQLRKQLQELTQLEVAIELQRRELSKLTASLSQFDEDALRAELVALMRQQREQILDLNRKLQSCLLTKVPELQAQELSGAARRARIARLEDALKMVRSLLHGHEQAWREAERNQERLKEEAQQLLAQASQEQMTEADRQEFSQIPDSCTELRAMITQLEAQASLLEGGQLIGQREQREYREREATIAGLASSLERRQARLDQVRNEASRVKERWLPALRAMVSDISLRFSSLFTRLGCVGEVQLTEKGEDYDEWELNILVQFREQSQLAQLSVQRQSGGERSVTTILFLLSLQQMAGSPFRVVDEINQGMDAANERRMHSLLVATAVQTAGLRSQYFLVTPKLLTGLEYHERMHVHCVYNGHGMQLYDTYK